MSPPALCNIYTNLGLYQGNADGIRPTIHRCAAPPLPAMWTLRYENVLMSGKCVLANRWLPHLVRSALGLCSKKL